MHKWELGSVSFVLGLARTGIIFTGLQVPVGGAARRGLTRGLGGQGAGPVRESGCLGRAVHCCVFSLFVSLLFLFPSVCCSVKLPLSRTHQFLPFSFHSPPQASRGRGGRVALLLPATAKTKTSSKSNFSWSSLNKQWQHGQTSLFSLQVTCSCIS